jgi:hypothetical protein
MHPTNAERFPQEVPIMWSGRKYAAMAIASVGLAVAAAAPASAQYRGAAGGLGDYGYAGVYSYGWPYATYGLAGHGSSGDYGYGGYPGAYGAAPGGYNRWGAGYGYYGGTPSYSYAGYPFNGRARAYGFGRGARHVPGYGYGVGDRLLYDQAFAAAQHRDFTARPAQDKIVYRGQNLKLAPAH